MPFLLRLYLSTCVLLVSALALYAQPTTRYAFSHPQMGTQFNIVLYAPDSTLARRAADAAFARIDTLNQRLSNYLPDSELNRLAATAGSGRSVSVSDDLWQVLAAAQHLSARTGGAFDVTIGPLAKLWRRAIRRNALPGEAEIAEARRAVGYQAVVLDSTRQTVRLTQPDMLLDLGGIAKGFAVDEALEVLRSFEVTAALVDGGGDIVVGVPPPGMPGWRIALSTVDGDGMLVQEERLLAHASIATSGDTYRFVEIDGVRYSHLIDPRSGMGLTHQSLVTVAAPDGLTADAFASAVSVLGTEAGLAFAAETPDVAARIVQTTEGRHRQIQTPGFDAAFRSAPPP